MAIVASATLLQDVWTNIYDVVKTVSDPKTRNFGSDGPLAWIHSAFPDTRSWSKKYPNQDFYPQVIISSPSDDEDRLVFDRGATLHTVSSTIEIVDTKMQRVDQLTDSIRQRLKDNETGFESKGMPMRLSPSAPAGTQIIDGNRVHTKPFDISFEVFV